MRADIKYLDRDVRHYPVIDPKESFQDRSATIGDLDGNFLNALHFLVRTHCITISKDQWQKFIEIYQKPHDEITADDLNRVETMLNKMQVLNSPNRTILLRFMGDTLCDKPIMGSKHDGITFLIYQWLQKSRLRYEVLISNHDLEAIYRMRGKKPDFIRDFQQQSWIALETLMEQNESIKKKYEEIFRTAYLGKLKLFSYETNAEHSQIHILSHAPSSILAIGYAARVLYLLDNAEEITQKTVLELINLIDNINRKFQLIVQDQPTLEKLYNCSNPEKAKAPINSPLKHAVWAISISAYALDSNDAFCKKNPGVALSFGCGHLGMRTWKDVANNILSDDLQNCLQYVGEKQLGCNLNKDGNPILFRKYLTERIKRYYHNYDFEKGLNFSDPRGSTQNGRILVRGFHQAILSPDPTVADKDEGDFLIPPAVAWGLCAVFAVFCIMLPVGVNCAVGASFLVSLTAMWPVMLGVAAELLIIGLAVYAMHKYGIFEVIVEKLDSFIPSLSKK